jgi:outer membrane protein assembly factor BamB
MRTVTLVACFVLAGCGGKQNQGPQEPDLDKELRREAEAKAAGIEPAPSKSAGSSTAANGDAAGSAAAAPGAKLTRFDLQRGQSRNGAGFRVLAREAPDGRRVVALEFDGTLSIGKDRYKGGKFGGVALVSYAADGTLEWARRLDHKDYHYVAALEVTASGDILVGGAFGERGMILMRFSPDGEARWTWQPEKEPKWAEVSSFVVDANGDIVLSGLFQSTLALPGIEPLKASYFDGFVAKLDADKGAIRWLKQLSSAEAKASAVVATDSGDIFVAGDYRKYLRVGGQELTGKRDFFIARFSPEGDVRYLAPVVARFVGNVIRVQPLAGELLALHLRGPENSELVVVAEKDGGIRWSVEDTEQGGALVDDANPRPDALHYAVQDSDPRYGSARMLVREIKREDKVRTVRVVDSGPYLFMSRGTVRRTAEGAFLIAGSLRDLAWDNDGFYPFMLEVEPDARRVDLTGAPVTGQGSGSRCKKVLAQKMVWRDLRVAVQQKLRQLGRCVADPSQFGATFDLQPDGTVANVSIEGPGDDQDKTCMTEVLQSVRVCPYKGGPYQRRLSQLR